MAKNKPQVEFPFYSYLNIFIRQEKKRIYSTFRPLTRKFLKFNDPEGGKVFLRPPQFQALEMYVFLKEFCENNFLFEIFEDWFKKQNKFESRLSIGVDNIGQLKMFEPIEIHRSKDMQIFDSVFKQIKSYQQIYPNYIFALTMGLGKTVLMATSIYYEFLLANKYPNDNKYCHNALVFAPDKTVLESLREIQTFDLSKVVPPEYVNWLQTNLKFYFLEETGDALNAIENSKYNIIISNTQKIILKRQIKEKSAPEKLFNDVSKIYKARSINKDFEDLYGFDIDTEDDLLTNQRFSKLTRLRQLGIYVDEAHHIFGKKLAQDFGLSKSSTSLRVTINELAKNLNEAGTSVIACYNYTGTPYVGNQLLPEVVYAYGLRDAINNKYLKKVKVNSFQNIKDHTLAFVRLTIQDFWDKNRGQRFENMLPKLAFFASTIEELQTELRPAVEKVLTELDISTSKILVNVGDSSITSNDDLREFKNLDTPASDKQFILLVNKGKEGWNCRSLFGVALHREPKSKIFVLQATMRCLRSIGPVQETAQVFLSEENIKILDAELQENFRITLDNLNNAGDNRIKVPVRLVPPPIIIKLKHIRKHYVLKEKNLNKEIDLKLNKIDTDKYKILGAEHSIFDLSKKITPSTDYTRYKDNYTFSQYTLVAEIARYLNISPVKIKQIFETTKQNIDETLKIINEYNEALYDWIIPNLFSEIYEIEVFERYEESEIELVKTPKDDDCYYVSAKPDLIASLHSSKFRKFGSKSFHLDHYCFDSKPENNLFWTLLHDNTVKKVWFTGMLTHGQTEFTINYIDPISNAVRSYYPDFLIQKEDDSYVIVEVKGDNMVDDEVVKAKADYAQQIASANNMTYKIIKGSDAMEGFGVS